MSGLHKAGGRFSVARLGLLTAVLAGISGCGGDAKSVSPTEKTVSVTGKVTLNDQPLTGGSLMFAPDREKGNQSALEMYGEIDSTGNYKVVSGVGNQKRDGAALGWYRVVVEAYEMPQEDKVGAESYGSDTPPRLITPEAYTDPKSSPLIVEVVETPTPGAYDLKLKK